MRTVPLTSNNDNGFVLWWTWFSSTMKKPVNRFNFWVYFIVGIIFCGGAGIWLSFLPSDKPSMLMSICSFYLAIAGASCIDFIFGEDERKYIRGFSILIAVILFLLTAFSYSGTRYCLAVIATIISLVLWWLANADNPKLADIAKPTAPLGGDENKIVSGHTGDLNV